MNVCPTCGSQKLSRRAENADPPFNTWRTNEDGTLHRASVECENGHRYEIGSHAVNVAVEARADLLIDAANEVVEAYYSRFAVGDGSVLVGPIDAEIEAPGKLLKSKTAGVAP